MSRNIDTSLAIIGAQLDARGADAFADVLGRLDRLSEINAELVAALERTVRALIIEHALHCQRIADPDAPCHPVTDQGLRQAEVDLMQSPSGLSALAFARSALARAKGEKS